MIEGAKFCEMGIRAATIFLGIICAHFIKKNTEFINPYSLFWSFFVLLFCIFVSICYQKKCRPIIRKGVYLLLVLVIYTFAFSLRAESLSFLTPFLTVSLIFFASDSSFSSEPDSSSTTITIPSSPSDSNMGWPPNAEPQNENLLSFFGNINPDLEMELYARIRLLENREIDRLPPQETPGQYEALVRDHLNNTISIPHYQSALKFEIFDIYVLELKANIQERLFNLMLQEPDTHLSTIFKESPFNEGAIREEALSFLEEQIETLRLSNPQTPFDKSLLQTNLTTWNTQLQEFGSNSYLYIGFVEHFRGKL